MNKNELIRHTILCHESKFGVRPAFSTYAPGRVEVLGNHTDYNEGFVLSAAVDAGICFVLSTGADGIELYAADLNESAETSVETLDLPSGWADYIVGVLIELRKLGAPLTGFSATFSGSIPQGAGLSSSAALETATALAVMEQIGFECSKLDVAKLCRQAEANAVGVQCGLLDQISSLYGEEGSLIHTDFRSLDVTTVPFPADEEFLICDTGVKHSLVDSEYNSRRVQCEAARDFFAERLEYPVSALRDVSPAEFAALRSELDDKIARRTAHVIGENDRVVRGIEFLKSGDLTAFGALMFESHGSSIHNFENSCEELDCVVSAAREAGALGARLSGGGFGGSAVVVVQKARAEEITEKLKRVFALKYNRSLTVFTAIPSAGADVVKRERMS